MITRTDPSRTRLLRAQFSRDMSQRFATVARDTRALIVDDDAFGLEVPKAVAFNVSPGPAGPPDEKTEAALTSIALAGLEYMGVTNAAKKIWAFKTDESKEALFREWLDGLLKAKVLSTVGAKGTPWLAKYVESAYRKGAVRAFTDSPAGKKARKGTTDFLSGSTSQFLRSAFAKPEQLSKVKTLYTRAYDDLKGITADMSSKLGRILGEGIAHGKNPRVIATEITKAVKAIDKGRALKLARTEVIRAHAEGQLDSFEALGVDEVGIFAEWSTAGDNKVCPKCKPLEGAVMTVKKARGLLPRHPNCRCAWIPAIDVKASKLKKSEDKIRKSIEAEGGSKKSGWPGKKLVGTVPPPKKKKAKKK